MAPTAPFTADELPGSGHPDDRDLIDGDAVEQLATANEQKADEQKKEATA